MNTMKLGPIHQEADNMKDIEKTECPFDRELNDTDLKHISGGTIKSAVSESLYEFNGNYKNPKDYNRMYECPVCGRIVRWGSWLRWYCDPCNQSWHEKSSQLLPNLNSGLWTSISQEEYDSRLTSINGR